MKRTAPVAMGAALILAAPAPWQAAYAETPAAIGRLADAAKRSPSTPEQVRSSNHAPNIADPAGNTVPVIQNPGSAVVIPRQVIDDQQDITVCGALRNVSGVSCR